MFTIILPRRRCFTEHLEPAEANFIALWVGKNRKDGNFSNLLYNFKIMEQIVILNRETAIRANVIARRTNARLVDGISKALLIEQLKKKLRSGQIVKFAYLKRDGSIRIAYGTTAADFIADKVCGWGESRENYACCAYYDLEKGWRSFRWENLIAVY